MANEPFALRGFARGGSRGHGQGPRHAPQELTEEIQGRTLLLPTRPPHRHQDRLRPRAGPGAAATPDLAQDDPEANRQLRIGLAGWRSLGEGGGLALAGAGGLVELAAEALVLSLQIAEASLKGLAAGTRDGLHTLMIGEPLAAAALPGEPSKVQLELDALNNYLGGSDSC